MWLYFVTAVLRGRCRPRTCWRTSSTFLSPNWRNARLCRLTRRWQTSTRALMINHTWTGYPPWRLWSVFWLRWKAKAKGRMDYLRKAIVLCLITFMTIGFVTTICFFPDVPWDGAGWDNLKNVDDAWCTCVDTELELPAEWALPLYEVYVRLVSTDFVRHLETQADDNQDVTTVLVSCVCAYVFFLVFLFFVCSFRFYKPWCIAAR